MTWGTITLLRHGETAWSKSGQHTGRTEVPLTAEGEQAARAVAPYLPRDPALVLCSPLERAQRTAQLAGLTVTRTDPDLLEWDYGAWEGCTTAQIRQELGKPAWTIWDEPIPPGQTPGEQLSDIRVRTARVIQACLPVLARGEQCVLVAHGHVLRILAATWLGLEPIAGRLLALDPATISTLGHEHEQQVICTWNAGVPVTQ